MARSLIAAAVAIITALPLSGQTVPTPREHFGFDIGEDRRLADWNQLTAYYEKVANASPRVTLDTIGQTTMGRPFIMLTITSEANQARIDELRDIQLRLADPRRIGSDAELQRLVEQGRTVVLITHAIHSTEVGGAQTAARMIHRLASSNDPHIREILDNVILLDIPSLNPDGTQWINEWYNKYVGTEFEGTSPPWLYQFYTGHDNNRDWYVFTQKETQHTILRAHNAWHPQIVHDIHQMGGNGARIFIPPFIDPVEPNVDPGIVSALNQLGASMAAQMTAQGKSGVVINAIYDAWTPARAYQHYHGGVRILSETASARLATPVEVPPERIGGGREYDASMASWNYPWPWTGGHWGLPDIVDYMESAALALLTNAATNREFWLRNFHEINRRATDGWDAWPAAWVIPADQANRSGLSYALRVLTMGDVEVHRATSPFTVGERQFASGTYVIPMRQPYASFAQTMLEIQQYPDLREYPGGPPRAPYDVTAHTLPMLMGFEAIEVDAWTAGSPPLSDPIPQHDWQFDLPTGLTGPGAPRIGMYKSWAETYESGWTRWMFDAHGLAYDTIKDSRMRAGNLGADYDVILLQSQAASSILSGLSAGSAPEEYTGGMGANGRDALREFVEQGGRLVAVEAATEFAIETFDLQIANAVAGLRRQDFYVPGSIVTLNLDTTVPLAAGVPESLHGWYWGDSRAFNVHDPSMRVIASYAAGNPVASGWILGPERLADKAALVEAPVGEGSVVLFGFQPNYRAHSVATWPLLFNALTAPRRR
ncbi:MAG TPA: M14 metallopeptidase family protein [Longimicrobiales bacterium]|nr:M14 metallopeptidase family protein [Longimicrobiales bacterium]